MAGVCSLSLCYSTVTLLHVSNFRRETFEWLKLSGGEKNPHQRIQAWSRCGFLFTSLPFSCGLLPPPPPPFPIEGHACILDSSQRGRFRLAKYNNRFHLHVELFPLKCCELLAGNVNVGKNKIWASLLSVTLMSNSGGKLGSLRWKALTHMK